MALDDALSSVAWNNGSSRSIRFSVSRGELWLLKNELLIVANVSINENLIGSYQIQSGAINYSIGNRYVNFGESYEECFIGENTTVTNSSTVGFGRGYIQGRSGRVNLIFYPAVRAMKTSVIQVKEGAEIYNVTYIDIWFIKLDIEHTSILRGEFDLKVRCMNITTPQTMVVTVSEGDICTITVQINGMANSVNIPINHNGRVVVSFIVSNVRVEV